MHVWITQPRVRIVSSCSRPLLLVCGTGYICSAFILHCAISPAVLANAAVDANRTLAKNHLIIIFVHPGFTHILLSLYASYSTNNSPESATFDLMDRHSSMGIRTTFVSASTKMKHNLLFLLCAEPATS